MRNYSRDEGEEKLSELKRQTDAISSEIEALRAKRNDLGVLRFSLKRDIDTQIRECSDELYFYNMASMMFMLYADSLAVEPKGGLSMEELIRVEDEAGQGDGISKLIIFCHSAFRDGDIRNREIRRLEMEACDGVRSSAAILECYRAFFE